MRVWMSVTLPGVAADSGRGTQASQKKKKARRRLSTVKLERRALSFFLLSHTQLARTRTQHTRPMDEPGRTVIPPPGTALVVRGRGREREKGGREMATAAAAFCFFPIACPPRPFAITHRFSLSLSLSDFPSPQEELDEKLMVQLRDGRKIMGVLRSFDQVKGRDG